MFDKINDMYATQDDPMRSVQTREINRPSLRNEQEPAKAGHGSCRACDCKGYRKSSSAKPNYCSGCGHHFDQHRNY